MDELPASDDSREFQCRYCRKPIIIPVDIPPTEGPCPHCGELVTSPAPPKAVPHNPKTHSTPSFLPGQKSEVRTIQSSGPKLTPIRDSTPPDNSKPIILTDFLPKGSGPSLKQTTLRKISPANHSTSECDGDPPRLKKIDHPAKVSADTKKKKTNPTLKKGNSTIAVSARRTLDSDINQQRQDDVEQFLTEESKTAKRSYWGYPLLLIPFIAVVYGALHYINRQAIPIRPNIIPADQQHLSDEFIHGGWINQARATLNAYMAASTDEGKAPYIIGGQTKLDELRSFYSGSLINDLDTPVDEFKPSPLSEIDHKRGLFRMVYTSNEPSTSDTKTIIHAYFKHTGDGLKLDWDVFAQTKHHTFHEFVTSPQIDQSSIFRAFVAQQTPSTKTDYLGFYISDPAYTTNTVQAFTEIGSEIQIHLSESLDQPKSQTPLIKAATIELTWEKTSNEPRLIISRLISWGFLGLGDDTPATDTP